MTFGVMWLPFDCLASECHSTFQWTIIAAHRTIILYSKQTGVKVILVNLAGDFKKQGNAASG